MSARARDLAERFERANEELVAMVERCSAADWRARCAGEEWAVAVIAHHVAEAYPLVVDFVRAVAAGGQFPEALTTTEAMHRYNARHAEEHARCTREETAGLLRRNGVGATRFICGLGDDQLDRASPVPLLGGAVWSGQQAVEAIMIGHIRGHLDSIRAALAAERARL